MALQKTMPTPQGFTATDAYHRVESVVLNSKTKISFRLRSYKGSSESVAFADHGYDCAYDMSGNNPIAQAYEYVKTISDFQDATDL
jgi:hypothetical protein